MPGEQTLSGHFRFRKGIILGLCKLLKIRRRFLRKIQGTYFKISALYFKIYGLYFLQDALCFSERPQTTEKMRGKTYEKNPSACGEIREVCLCARGKAEKTLSKQRQICAMQIFLNN